MNVVSPSRLALEDSLFAAAPDDLRQIFNKYPFGSKAANASIAKLRAAVFEDLWEASHDIEQDLLGLALDEPPPGVRPSTSSHYWDGIAAFTRILPLLVGVTEGQLMEAANISAEELSTAKIAAFEGLFKKTNASNLLNRCFDILASDERVTFYQRHQETLLSNPNILCEPHIADALLQIATEHHADISEELIKYKMLLNMTADLQSAVERNHAIATQVKWTATDSSLSSALSVLDAVSPQLHKVSQVTEAIIEALVRDEHIARIGDQGSLSDQKYYWYDAQEFDRVWYAKHFNDIAALLGCTRISAPKVQLLIPQHTKVLTAAWGLSFCEGVAVVSPAVSSVKRSLTLEEARELLLVLYVSGFRDIHAANFVITDDKVFLIDTETASFKFNQSEKEDNERLQRIIQFVSERCDSIDAKGLYSWLEAQGGHILASKAADLASYYRNITTCSLLPYYKVTLD